MGKMPHGMHGVFQGKVGKLVGSSWKGIPYVKAKPAERSAARGVEEKKNQTRFSELHYWLKPIIHFLRVGFKGYSPTIEGFIAAKSYALRNAYVVENGSKVLDPTLVKVSYGDLPLPEKIEFEKTDDNTVRFTWNADSSYQREAAGRDQVMLLAYAPSGSRIAGETSMELTGQFRETGSDTLKLKKGITYHLYIAFVAHDRSRQSDSRYLGTVS
jgi:hypothetical protein